MNLRWHEAIWTGEEWDGYRERREARRAMSPRSHNPAYPLTGLIRCGYPLNDNAHGQSCYAYHCGARARHAVVHDTVWIRRAVVEARVYDWLIEVREEIDAIAAGTVVVPPPHGAGCGRAAGRSGGAALQGVGSARPGDEGPRHR
ncbi:zinc ribbon domain-containing protein [Streptomyces virginiae]|uniref:zinc ribbon domain-containing protein n=1 Tax=Streptomyces virginiae TaxID=1961 RepID=UPI0033B5BF84